MRRCINCWGSIQPDDDTCTTKHGPRHADPDLCQLLQRTRPGGHYPTGDFGPRLPAKEIA